LKRAAEAFVPLCASLSRNDGLIEPAGHGRIDAESVCTRTVKLYLSGHAAVVAPETATAGLTEAHQTGRSDSVRVAEDEPALRDLIVEVPVDVGGAALQAAHSGAGLD
jgi:hypothetical protein